jgi:hypothetical protein
VLSLNGSYFYQLSIKLLIIFINFGTRINGQCLDDVTYVTLDDFNGFLSELPSDNLTCLDTFDYLPSINIDPISLCKNSNFQFSSSCCLTCKSNTNIFF